MRRPLHTSFFHPLTVVVGHIIRRLQIELPPSSITMRHRLQISNRCWSCPLPSSDRDSSFIHHCAPSPMNRHISIAAAFFSHLCRLQSGRVLRRLQRRDGLLSSLAQVFEFFEFLSFFRVFYLIY